MPTKPVTTAKTIGRGNADKVAQRRRDKHAAPAAKLAELKAREAEAPEPTDDPVAAYLAAFRAEHDHR